MPSRTRGPSGARYRRRNRRRSNVNRFRCALRRNLSSAGPPSRRPTVRRRACHAMLCLRPRRGSRGGDGLWRTRTARLQGRRGFADLLLDLRVQRAALSQEELADRAGLSVRTIRELEAGRVARPRKDSVRLLADALGLQGGDAAELPRRRRARPARPVRRGGRPGRRPVLRWRGTRPIPDGLVGREQELAELEGLLRQNRLVTLVGPGGVGKTELALAAADRFSGVDTTVVVVDLTVVQRDAAVPSAILDAFGTAPGTTDLDDVLSAPPARRPGDRRGQRRARARRGRDRGEPDGPQLPGHRRAGHLPDPARAARRGGTPGGGAAACRRTTRTWTRSAASPAVEMFCPARGPGPAGLRGSPSTTRRPWPGCAAGWTGCRWRWSWPPPGPGRCRWRRSWPRWTTGSGAVRAAPVRGAAPADAGRHDRVERGRADRSGPAAAVPGLDARLAVHPATRWPGSVPARPIDARSVPMLLAELVDKSLLQPVEEFEQLYGSRYKMLETIREHAYAGSVRRRPDVTDRVAGPGGRLVPGVRDRAGGCLGQPGPGPAVPGRERELRHRSRSRWNARPSWAAGTWPREIVLGFRIAWQYQASVAESGIGWATRCAEHVDDKQTRGKLRAIAGRLSSLTGDVRAARRNYGEARQLIPGHTDLGLLARAGWVSSGSLLLDPDSLAEIPSLVADAIKHGNVAARRDRAGHLRAGAVALGPAAGGQGAAACLAEVARQPGRVPRRDRLHRTQPAGRRARQPGAGPAVGRAGPRHPGFGRPGAHPAGRAASRSSSSTPASTTPRRR